MTTDRLCTSVGCKQPAELTMTIRKPLGETIVRDLCMADYRTRYKGRQLGANIIFETLDGELIDYSYQAGTRMEAAPDPDFADVVQSAIIEHHDEGERIYIDVIVRPGTWDAIRARLIGS